MDRLMEKLALSKAIMDKADGIKSSNSMNGGLPPTSLQQFDVPNAKYNIPSEFLQEGPSQQTQYLSSVPRENTKPVGNPTVDAIKNSKLPDASKRLMMEHPIAQPNQAPTMTMSNELIEKSRRLMGHNEGSYIPESAKPKSAPIQQSEPTQNTGINYKLIQKMINEAVTKSLKENGLIAESTEKSNETFSFKVGKHVFEGRVTKIKKMS